jgi:hypothetical protein
LIEVREFGDLTRGATLALAIERCRTPASSIDHFYRVKDSLKNARSKAPATSWMLRALLILLALGFCIGMFILALSSGGSPKL